MCTFAAGVFGCDIMVGFCCILPYRKSVWNYPHHHRRQKIGFRIRISSWLRHQMAPFSALLALCAGNSPVPVNSTHKGQWRGALMFSLICAWINESVNNRDAGDLRCHRGHYDVIVMMMTHAMPLLDICERNPWLTSYLSSQRTRNAQLFCFSRC